MNTSFNRVRLGALLEASNVSLRHDVDYDPECALRMAEYETELGVHSVFYIRPLEDYTFPVAALAFFNEISGLGQELGLHVDLCMGRDAEVPDAYMSICCEQDFLCLSELLPVSRKVSFHAPPKLALWRPIQGFDHAMTKEWCGRYVSDSRGVFRRSPEQALAKATSERPLQLNLHSEWWFWSSVQADEWRLIESTKP